MPVRLILSLVVAFVAATVLTTTADRRPFEEKVERAAIVDQANTPGTKCPLSPEYIEKADLGPLRICLRYGLSAYDAAQRYPDAAAMVFAVYGEDETFQKILDQYGHQVIPIVAYFVDNGSFKYQAREALGEVLEQIWARHWPKWQLPNLTREQIGLLAIYEIADRGNEILAEFEVVGGIAKPKPVTGAIFEVKQFLLSGAGNLEKVLVRGERLPTWQETALAGLDVAVLAGGVGAVAKVARLGGEALAEEGTASLVAENAYKTVTFVGKTAVRVAPYAALYVVVTRPTLIPYLAGRIAELFGLSRYVGIFAAYFAAAFLLLEFLRPFIWCGNLVSWPFRRLRNVALRIAASRA